MAKGKLTKDSPYKIAPVVAAAIIGGVASIGGALISSSGRNKPPAGLRAAQARRDELMERYQDYDFQYTNPYEDATVNLQAAKLQQQGLAQQQADILEGLRGGTSGAGAAALATGLARQAAKTQRQIVADLGEQEARIEMKQAEAEAEGQRQERQFEIARMQEMLGMSMEEVAAIQGASLQQQQNQASTTAGIIGAVGNVAGAYVGTL